ncbi:histidinol dehydrogenase [Candidatus Nasuia deltocephalinicola]|uniref:Histidinol dehydrogenase n=1 Tax=Candidatus Nasuia deltocephalincola TaxID=1160784 RepID=A0A975A3B4_9PROT|nr:histidinol dehydrogenase [Candidatus Nasuia deltocephalinicola]
MLKININKIDINNKNFYNIIKNLNNFRNKNYIKVENYIKNIIYNIKNFKDKSLKFYLKNLESNIIKDIKEIELKKTDLEKSFYKLDNETRFMLEVSKNRIEKFHREQKKNFINNWKIIENDGNIMGQKYNKINRMGFYIPAGKALYPSSVFMNIIPAKISNIENITVCSPKIEKKNNLINAALFLCGLEKMYSIGGIPAIASMGYGNKIIEKVDKICGPGNIYVSISKKLFFGKLGIDIIAGPSEITIITDGKNSIKSTIMDIFSQSEHDKLSQSIVICDNNNFINDLELNIKKYLPFLYRKKILYNSIINNIILIKVNNINDSFNILNYISPEHLVISLKNSLEFFKNIENSGSIFLGKKICESLGDYSLGSNHIIPTNKNCNYSSPLGINDFYKNLNFLKTTNKSFKKLFNLTLKFSKCENLYSHGESLIFHK